MEKKRTAKTSIKEYEAILEFIEKNKIVLTGKTKPLEANKVSNLWQQFANKMNASGLGPPRSVDKWRKIFNEWKVNVRRKSREILIDLNRTGGGPSTCKSLTDLEERLLGIISKIHLGDESLPDTLGGNLVAEINYEDFPVEIEPESIPFEINELQIIHQENDEYVEELPEENLKRKMEDPTSQRKKVKSNSKNLESNFESACSSYTESQAIKNQLKGDEIKALYKLTSVIQEKNEILREKLELKKKYLKIKTLLAKAKWFDTFRNFDGFDDD